MRILPDTWARTLWPFSISTRNIALGNGSTTLPSTSIASSLLILLLSPFIGVSADPQCGDGLMGRRRSEHEGLSRPDSPITDRGETDTESLSRIRRLPSWAGSDRFEVRRTDAE